jgi:thymidylate kinase
VKRTPARFSSATATGVERRVRRGPGPDVAWLIDIQKYLPQPDITFLLDIPPEVSARRKTKDRDKFERDLEMLARVRESYVRRARSGWVRLDATRDRDAIAADVYAAVSTSL